MINQQNGEFHVHDINLCPGYTRQQFEESKPFDFIERVDKHAFTVYSLKQQYFKGSFFKITVLFNELDILYMILINIIPARYLFKWQNWSESEHKNNKKRHDKWLVNNIGHPPYRYHWGEVFSEYDPRSNYSLISIRYY